MIAQPDMELFNEVFKICKRLGYDVFPYRPSNEVNYPFVYIGQTIEVPRATKSTVIGEIEITVHIYGNEDSRAIVAQMKGEILQAIRHLKTTDNYCWSITNNTTQPVTMLEQNANQAPQLPPLWHVVLPINIKYY